MREVQRQTESFGRQGDGEDVRVRKEERGVFQRAESWRHVGEQHDVRVRTKRPTQRHEICKHKPTLLCL